MEEAVHGDLFDYTLRINTAMGEGLARHFFLQVLNGVEYLHNSVKVVHRDIKLENILLCDAYSVKLCDFTLARTLHEGSMVGVFYTNCGSERYMAPEVLEGKPYKGTQADVFSLGVTLFVLVTGVMPFDKQATKDDVLYRHLFKGNHDAYWDTLYKLYAEHKAFNSQLTDEFKRLIVQFFEYHHFERITLDKVREHKWLDMPLTYFSAQTQTIKPFAMLT